MSMQRDPWSDDLTAGPSSRAASRAKGSTTNTKQKKKKSPLANVLEWVLILAVAISVAFVVRTYLIGNFYIPSESMVPTLQVGDKVLVNKMSYRLHDVRRGDIVVFEAPPGEATEQIQDLVKRVIGLPGDTIQGKQGDGVYINGKRLDEPYLPKGVTTKDFGPVTVPPGQLFMMGDNRFESKDSTFFGPIKEDSIVGRVFVLYWPFGHFQFF
ncbi:MAG: signal peptidase I [Acidimicrobiia bacterium]